MSDYFNRVSLNELNMGDINNSKDYKYTRSYSKDFFLCNNFSESSCNPSLTNERINYNEYTFNKNNNIFLNTVNNYYPRVAWSKSLIRPVFQRSKENFKKNRLSDYILKNKYKPEYQPGNLYSKNYELNNNKKSGNDKEIKVIQVRKKLGRSHSKSDKKINVNINRNLSQNKSKKKITQVFNDLLIEKDKANEEYLINLKKIKNIDNYYKIWSDNDGHMGGKINLGMNNPYRNQDDFLSSLYFIVKIQSVWRGYYFRRYLFYNNIRNIKINIFHKQKLFLGTLFNILNYNLKQGLKSHFNSFKEKIKIYSDDRNKNKIDTKKGYDLNSSFLNNISNSYQGIFKNKTGQCILYNKKMISERKKSESIYHKNRYNSDLNSPQKPKHNSKINYNFYSNRYRRNNYKTYRVNNICYVGKKEDDTEKGKVKIINETKNNYKNLYMFSDDETTTNTTNRFNINRKGSFVYKNKQISLNKNKNKKKAKDINNKLNKYKEYIYFLFLLFARIQKASHRLIFRKLVDSLNKQKINNLKKEKMNKLLNIIKNNERKKKRYYYKKFKEKVLIEKLKEMILNGKEKDKDKDKNKNILKVIKIDKNRKNGNNIINIKTLKKASTLNQNNNNSINNINANIINNAVISKSFCQPFKKMNFN